MLVPFPAPRIEHLAAPIIASLIIALVVTIPMLNHTLTLSPQLIYNAPNHTIIPVATALYILLFLGSGFVLPVAGQHVSTSQVLKQASFYTTIIK